MKIMIVIQLVVLFTAVNLYSATIYVKYDASGSNNGTSWTNAYTSFQSALNDATSGDQIWVAKGTYKPSSAYDLTNNSRLYHFRMVPCVEIFGGFAGTETAVSQRTDFGDGGTNETILSGDLNGDDNYSPNPATDNLTIELPNAEMQSIEIRDMKGKLIMNEEIHLMTSSHQMNIDALTNRHILYHRNN